jgi:hypothetical protein
VPGDVRKRYSIFKDFIAVRPDLRVFFTHLEFVEKGILIGDNPYPILRMKWVHGKSLYQYIQYIAKSGNLESARRAFLKLADAWMHLLLSLQKAKVAHGDLWSDNIYVCTDASGNATDACGYPTTGLPNIVLLDYDSIYVPDLVNPPRVVDGVGGYRNPVDLSEGSGPDSPPADSPDSTRVSRPSDDHFSGLGLLVTLLALVDDPSRWKRYGDKNTEPKLLLFTEKDFQQPSASPLFQELRMVKEPILKQLFDWLEYACEKKLPSHELPALAVMLEKPPLPPQPQVWLWVVLLLFALFVLAIIIIIVIAIANKV